jgi:phosphopantetheine--protein transferase-like protein
MNESLRNLVAELLAVPADQVGSDRVLTGARLQGSLGRSILDAAMRRRLGIQSPACYTAKTYGELESAINGSASSPIVNGTFKAPPPAITLSTDSIAGQTACGIDIELVESLPPTTDFWTHEFYTTHFTPGEIAYCLTQQSPPMHFAARWCAKEALKKCEPGLLNESPQNIEVVSQSDGRPTLRHLNAGAFTPLPHALSLSHTTHAAVAMVVRVVTPAPMAPPAPIVPAISNQIAPARPSRKSALLSIALSLLALAVATAALELVIRHH